MAHGRVEDPARHLTRRGEQDAARLGAALRSAGIRPDVVVASDAERTRRTAEIVVADDGWRLDLEPDVYEASPSRLVEVVARLPASAGTALLVAHEPAASGLVVALAGPPADARAATLRARVLAGLGTAEAGVLRWDGGWGAVSAACAHLDDVLTPVAEESAVPVPGAGPTSDPPCDGAA